jgi:hypothetical protein
MLERVRGAARTVCGPIEDLNLGERFDVVLLASFLVTPSRTPARPCSPPAAGTSPRTAAC